MELKLPEAMTEDEFAKLSKDEANKIVDEQLRLEERPDQLLIRRTVEAIERNVAAFDFKNEVAMAEDRVLVKGELVGLNTVETTFKVPAQIVDPEEMYRKYFEVAAQLFVRMINAEGYNVCRPCGIVDNNLTAREGTLQLYKIGAKVSLYMSHRYVPGDPAHTEVKLLMLVGKRSE